MRTEAKYDYIGAGYNTTRKADPYLVERLLHHLRPRPGGLHLDIGCGTGNYTDALHRRGVALTGMDPSGAMLEKARQKNPGIDWKKGLAEQTGLDDRSMDGIVATLTLHHWTDLWQGFREMYRVLKKGGRLVIFTSDPEQMKRYWLNRYFPQMLRDSIIQMPAREAVLQAMTAAGFTLSKTELYSVRPDLEDLFLYAGKHRPELYFRPEVRNGISSFSALAHREEVRTGLARLQADVDSGAIASVMQAFDHDGGDYLYIVGTK